MNRTIPLIATLLISALAYPSPIVKDNDKANIRPPSISIIDISDDSSSSSSSSSSSIEFHEDYFNCARYGPFEAGCPDFNVIFTYAFYSIGSQRIIERVRFLDSSNNVLAATTKSSKDYTKGQLNDVTFAIKTHDYLTSSGLTLYFEIINSSTYKVLKRYETTFYPVKKETISYSELKKGIYTSKSFGFQGTGSGLSNTKEEIDFRPFGDYLNVNYYYELEFTNNNFYYLSPYILNYQNINLRFNDSTNQFPYMTHDSNGDIILPLSLYMSGSKATFIFKNKYYVNKKTLQMSDTYRTNYILTNRFYLPINGRKRFNNKMLYIEIGSLGYSHLSTTIPLRYSVSKSLFGLSNDGENYVIGGNK